MADDDTKLTTYYAGRVEDEGIERHTEESLEWFRINLRKLRKIYPNQFEVRHREYFVGRPMLGKMYTFIYDPKTKEKLPYYDIFPLIFVLRRLSDGFIGINLHYLSPKDRETLYLNLLSKLSDDRYDDETKLKLTYRLLNGLAKRRFAKAIVKRYLYSHLDSRLMEIPSDVWEVALMLRTEAFVKEVRREVWRDTRRKAIQGF
jgi:hypothetical protein